MNKGFPLNIPDYKLFDFHRYLSNIEIFDENLKEFNISKLYLMPLCYFNSSCTILLLHKY